MRFIFLVTLLFVSSWASAYQLPDHPFSLRVRDAGIRDVLEGLLAETDFKFDIDPAISNDAHMSFSLSKQAWSEIFTRVLREAHLTYGFDRSGVILIMRQ
jgi:type II secretory pathway component GspD/PulD (secretin)